VSSPSLRSSTPTERPPKIEVERRERIISHPIDRGQAGLHAELFDRQGPAACSGRWCCSEAHSPTSSSAPVGPRGRRSARVSVTKAVTSGVRQRVPCPGGSAPGDPRRRRTRRQAPNERRGLRGTGAGSTPDVVGVLELGDRPLGHLEAPGELRLAHRLGVAELVEADLLQRLGPLGREPLLGARARLELLAEFGELGSSHQINPSSRSSARYVS